MRSNLSLTLVLGLAWLCVLTSGVSSKKPNILMFIVDDLGWNDVSFNGAEYETPTVDQYAKVRDKKRRILKQI